MLAIVGTVPSEDFPIVEGEVSLEGDNLYICGLQLPVCRGTPALAAAAVSTCKSLGSPLPYAYVIGDTGLGDGSRRLYEYLVHNVRDAKATVFAFHYLQPDVDWHNKVLFGMEEIKPKPLLIADAGFMYAAKMSGQARSYKLFTPDAGELAFLADEQAPHPFYTRGFILHQDAGIPELISRAYKNDNSSEYLLVKGSKDYVADTSGIRAIIDSPANEAMEAIGGTGDTLTGIVSALISSGMGIVDAAIAACRANRFAGHYAQVTPASQVIELIKYIPKALETVLEK